MCARSTEDRLGLKQERQSNRSGLQQWWIITKLNDAAYYHNLGVSVPVQQRRNEFIHDNELAQEYNPIVN